MAQKKIITLEKLGTFKDEVVKVIKAQDDAVLEQSKSYSDSLAENYDAAGSATTAETNAKNYTNEQIETVNETIEGVKTQADKGVSDAKVADDKAVVAQKTADGLKDYVGVIPEDSSATDVIGFVNEKTANIASDATVNAIQARVEQAEKDIDAIEADYLKASDRTELTAKITEAQNKANAAQSYAEGVASDLTSAKTTLESADSAQVARITTLEGKIEGLTGAMHFRGVVTALPEDVNGYAEGDVIIVGEKEYVFNGTEFKEFGDVSAEGKRISTLETEMDTVEADVAKAQTDIAANTSDIAKKADKTDVDAKVVSLESTDSALDTRVKAIETTVGASGSIATDIANAKAEAIATAADDATTKANNAEANAKVYTNIEVGKDRTRLDALETDSHVHDNKDLLDTYDQTNANIKDAVVKKHNHENIDVLNEIDANVVAKWDKVTDKADTTALTAETSRATAAEAELSARIDDFVEASETEVKALFA